MFLCNRFIIWIHFTASIKMHLSTHHRQGNSYMLYKRYQSLTKQVLNSQTERNQDLIDYKFFKYTHYNLLDTSPSTHALYIEGHKHNSTIYNVKAYQQSQYDKTGITITNYAEELKFPVFLDSGCMVSAMQKINMISIQLHTSVKDTIL